MDNQNNIQDELRSLNSGLPGENSRNPFSVPEGYFDGLASSLLAKVKAQEGSAAAELQQLSPLLAGLSKALPYAVPDGYFTQNIDSLPAFTSEDEASPLLTGIGKDMPYTVPPAYFDSLPQQVLARLAPQKAKVVPLFARTWMRVATAAAITGIVFLGGYRYLNSGKAEGSANVQPVDTSGSLVAKNERKTTPDLRTVSTKELDEFMKTVPVSQASQPENESSSTDVNNLLKGVSAKEMDAFLEQLPTSDEDLALID